MRPQAKSPVAGFAVASQSSESSQPAIESNIMTGDVRFLAQTRSAHRELTRLYHQLGHGGLTGPQRRRMEPASRCSVSSERACSSASSGSRIDMDRNILRTRKGIS